MTIALDKMLGLCHLTVVSLVMFTCCQSEISLDRKVLEGVLKEALLTYDLYDSTLNNGVIVIGDTTILLSEGDRESINRHLEEIITGDTVKKSLVNKLLSESSKEIIGDIRLTNLKVQRRVIPADKVIGRVYVSSIVVSENSSLALFFYRFRCGRDCGSGNIVFAKLNRDKWEIELFYPLYII